MATTTTTRLGRHAALATLLIAVAAGAPVNGPHEAHGIVLVGVPAHYAELVGWAAALFEEAGLELPPVVVTHHGDDREPCHGRAGWQVDREGHSFVELCTLQDGVLAERLVLHELAHAWADHGLTDARREAFRTLRSCASWTSREGLSWADLGSEQAAEIVAWALSDRPIRSVLVDRSSCAEFELGYRALTGTPPPHGLPDGCRAGGDAPADIPLG